MQPCWLHPVPRRAGRLQHHLRAVVWKALRGSVLAHCLLFLPGNAIRPPTGATAATWCAAAEATTPTWTKWWSDATASTTGAATWPVKSARGLSRDMCANENPPLSTWELRRRRHPSTIQRRENLSLTRRLVKTQTWRKMVGGKKTNPTSKNKTLKKHPAKPTNVSPHQ